ncbi:hypothetical protein V495_04596 [Pseudogymnoascus sp. VKM F-4514 (FW-929)]|nr:hypothetical protein V495_04596 [Pseudogymnoascus sp. VKM F-4514 (FW-929)]KFY53687.1 hypothetical protein V497_08306 [Pseudogymnoascus sp. VKM F-4516 (FW-969)]
MVHLYVCTLCKKEISADDNRIQCVDCGSEICGTCYLRKKTSHYHSLTHENYIMAEFSGSMYIRPPAPPMLAALKENKPTKKAKPAATPQKMPRIVKRERAKKGYSNRPAAAPRTHPASRKLKARASYNLMVFNCLFYN